MTIVLIACGIPGVGKTTVLNQNFMENGVIRLSSDDIIEFRAKLVGLTYDAVFEDSIEHANSAFWNLYEEHLLRKTERIILDRTFVSPKSRKRVLNLARQYGFDVGALSFKLPGTDLEHKEWNRRLTRPGKTIPDPILIDMYCSFVPPGHDEGFSHLENIDTFED
jgi:predicted kinase